MKNLIVYFMMSGLFTNVHGQDLAANQLPATVSQAFESKFSNVMEVEWEKKRDLYEVDFEIQKVDYKALFDQSGKMLKYKKDFPETELPAAIRSAITSNYSGYVVDDVDKLFIGTKSYYQVELDGKILDKKVVFSEDGKEQNKVDYWD